MINTKLTAHDAINGREIILETVDGEVAARFASAAMFYVVTGFKSVESYNEHHANKPVKFLVWKREH